MLATLTSTRAHQYAVLACEFIKTRRVGLALAAGPTLLVAVVEEVEVIAINAFADKDIRDEF